MTLPTRSLLQDPGPAADSGWWGFLEHLAAEPALVELLLVLVAAAVLGTIYLRLSRMARSLQRRAAVRDYLLGVEQALSGDLEGAAKRLAKVLEDDPENRHARLLYGEVLAELGDLAEAHRHHVVLRRAFDVDGPRNRLDLAEILLDLGHEAEAVDELEQLVADRPEDVRALRLLFRAQLRAGMPEDAGRTGARLARVCDGDERRRVLARAAEALATAGEVRLGAGDPAGARRLAEEARALDGGGGPVRRLRARLTMLEGGPAAVERQLLEEDAEWSSRRDRDDTSGAVALLAPPPADATGEAVAPVRGRTHALRALAPVGWYRCGSCGGEIPRGELGCPHCGAERLEALEPGLLEELESPSEVMDEIDENRSYVRRLITRLAAGDLEAEQDLVEVGEGAVEELLLAATAQETLRERVAAALRAMGPMILPSLFEAFDRLSSPSLLDLAGRFRRPSAEVLGCVVQGFGRDALPYFETLLGTESRELRKVVLDFYIGLGDPDELAKALEHYPPIEVLHRLNAASGMALRGLFANLRRGSFLAEGLLLEPIFSRETELLAAVADGADPELVVDVLVRRGFSRSLAPTLLDRLVDPSLGPVAGRILDAFGEAALDHLIAAFADLDRPEALHRAIEDRLVRMGAVVAERATALLGPAPSVLDQHVERLLLRIGDEAVAPLVRAYSRAGVVERLVGPLANRYTHRRAFVARVLGRLGAEAELEQLAQQETDTNLRLRLGQAQARAREVRASEAGAKQEAEEEDRGQAG